MGLQEYTSRFNRGETFVFLLFRMDCRSTSKAVLLPREVVRPTEFSDYREQLGLDLSSARDSVASSCQKAQNQYKTQFDRKSSAMKYSDGDWVLVRFPQEESGKNRKLSQPWHGPYRVTKCLDPDVIVAKVYFPEYGAIQVHQSRVNVCVQRNFQVDSTGMGRSDIVQEDHPKGCRNSPLKIMLPCGDRE